jgi:hypothetical protein
MGLKRLKLAQGLGDVVPISINFSVLEQEYEENSAAFEAGDEGFESRRLEENMMYEEMIVQILCNMEMREKLVFLYQLLRDEGYQIDHAAFAKTVGLSRRQYMRVLEEVRLKSTLFVMGFKKALEKSQESQR